MEVVTIKSINGHEVTGVDENVREKQGRNRVN